MSADTPTPAEPPGPRDYCAHIQPACDECRNPVEATPADVYLDAARRYYNAMDMSPGQHAPMSTDEMIEWLANGEPDVGEAERDPIWFRAAVDAARAPLLAENADLRERLGVATSVIDRLAAVDDPFAEVLRLHERLAIVTEDRKARTLERDRLVDTLTATRAEAEQFHARLAADGFVAVTREQAEGWRAVEAERDQARAEVARVRADYAAAERAGNEQLSEARAANAAALRRIKALDGLLACYRAGRQPSDRLHRELAATSAEMEATGG